MTAIAQPVLDAILSVQFLVAWAGEGRCEPNRLGWWETDLVDEGGGGNLFARLAPRTGAWASFEAVRDVARRADAKARTKMANPDRMRTLFFLGFDIDEQVGDRLAALKRSAGERAARDGGAASPTDMLGLPRELIAGFSKDRLARVLRELGDGAHVVVPGGRQLVGVTPASPDDLVRRLAAGLLPLADIYPLPFFPLDR